MSRVLKFLPLCLLVFNYYATPARAAVLPGSDTLAVCDSCPGRDSLCRLSFAGNRELKILTRADSVKTSRYKGKKLIAVILAFPVPFGLLGLHRVFLGTKPYVPFVYIGTIGGCFLILPIIDFVAILTSNEETFRRFENNSRVFMWSH